jgi:hypothetical protein
MPLTHIQHDLGTALADVISNNLNRVAFNPDVQWGDGIISELCSLWRPEGVVAIPGAILNYLNHRKSEAALMRVVWDSGIGVYLWTRFPTTISERASHSRTPRNSDRPDEVITSLWVLASLNYVDYSPRAPLYESVLNAISMQGLSRTSASVVALVNKRILEELSLNIFVNNDATVGEVIASFTHDLFRTDTAIQIPDNWRLEQTTDGVSASQLMKYRINEAEIHVLAEFTDSCNLQELPHRAVETLTIIAADTTPRASIHKTHQLRMANAVVALFANNRLNKLLNTILHSSFLDFYADSSTAASPNVWGIPWLDDPTARGSIKESFLGYEQRLALSSTEDSPPTLARLRAIVRGFEICHPQPQQN